MKLRRQLSVYSPIPPRAILRGTGAALRLSGDARPAVAQMLREEFGADVCTLYGSGTQALQAALTTMRSVVGPSSSIALPAFSCFDVASAAIGAGGPVTLYDIDPETLAPDTTSLERVLEAGSRIVVIAPLYGVPVPWDDLKAQAARHGAVLIEDASQGHGASWKGRPLGSLGRVSTLSFGRGKGWTGGSGGAVLVRESWSPPTGMNRHPALRRELTTLAALGAQTVLGRPSIYGLPHAIPGLHLGETTYKDPSSPVAMTRAAAAVLQGTLARSSAEGALRRRNAKRFLDSLSHSERVRAVVVPPQGQAGYLRLPILVTGGAARLSEHSAFGELGLARSYPIVLGRLDELSPQMASVERSWPGAEQLVRELVTLPAHSIVTTAEQDRIVDLLLG